MTLARTVALLSLSFLAAPASGCKRDAASGSRADETPSESKSETETESAAPDDASVRDSPYGWYRAVLEGEGGEQIPFFLLLPQDKDRAVVDVDSAAFEAPYRFTESGLELEFSGAHTRIEATREKNGTLVGNWTANNRAFGEASLAFRATLVTGPDPALRFEQTGASDGDAAGVWKLDLADSSTASLAIEKTDGDGVRATLAFLSGNIVALHGSVRGNQLTLSAFDGSSPYLLAAELDGDAIAGTWMAGPTLRWRETFRGMRDGDFELSPEIRVVGDDTKLSLDVLDTEPYRNKPVLVELSGSWCPACGHAIAPLKQLYDSYHSRGLEIITLNYEFTDDADYNERQTEQYKKAHGLAWEVQAVTGDIESAAEIIPSELDNVSASGFPIAIFVNRDRSIEAVQAGFPPPESKRAHRAMVESYERTVKAIIAPPAAKRSQ